MIEKQRNGPTGEVIFTFDRESISFEPYAYFEGERAVRSDEEMDTVDDYESYGGV